jgi:hypothetical protein
LLQPAGLCVIRGRVRRWSSLTAEGRRLFATVDEGRLAALIAQYPAEGEQRKARENEIMLVYIAHVLGLNASPPLRILDIGSKAGMFPFIARCYGHDAWASDLPEVLARQPTAGLLELLRVHAVPLRVEAFTPLPDLGRRFDLISGFRTRFHSRYPWETGREREEHWGVKEWDFFLRDLAANQLTERGHIFFMLNRLQDMARRTEVPADLDAYFRSVGGRLQDLNLYFETLEHLRSPLPAGPA